MRKVPSPILIYGDPVLAKKDLVKIKAKYSDFEWVEMSLEDNSHDKIRMEAGLIGFGSNDKILLLNEIPNSKATREFLIALAKETRPDVSIIIWDSEEAIKADPKTRLLNDTWSDFISKIKAIDGHKIIPFGSDFGEKEDQDVVKYIQGLFSKSGKQIHQDAAKLLSTMVGRKRSMLASEVEKLSLTAPLMIDKDFISKNAFPVTQEAILWKFGNVVDEGNFVNSIASAKEYVECGAHPNVLAEILCKKARWQLAACSLWSTGMSWADVEQQLLQMGKFPSSIWRKPGANSEKKARTDKLKEPQAAIEWWGQEMGLDPSYFKDLTVKGAKIKGGETIPMPFMASLLVKHIQSKYVEPNSKIPTTELRQKLLNKMLGVYSSVLDSMKNMRYNSMFEQELYEMIRALSNYRL